MEFIILAFILFGFIGLAIYLKKPENGPEAQRSEERREGKEGTPWCRSRWSPENSKKKTEGLGCLRVAAEDFSPPPKCCR